MAYQKVYMNQIFSSSLLCQMSQLWKRDILCDAVLKTGQAEVKAHRVVLVAASPMLQSMDAAGSGNRLEVKLSTDILPKTVETFLQYLYDGFMMLTEDNVRDVERIARLLQVDSVIKCCTDFCKVLESEVGHFVQHDNKFNLHTDEADFKHVRSSGLLRSVGNGCDKRPADFECKAGRKKLKPHRMSRTSPSEERFELVQTDMDETGDERLVKSQQSLSLSVAGTTAGGSDGVHVLDIDDTSWGSGGSHHSSVSRLSQNNDFSDRTSPCSNIQNSYHISLRHKTGGRSHHGVSNLDSDPGVPKLSFNGKHSVSQSQCKSRFVNAEGASGESDQIVIQPMERERGDAPPAQFSDGTNQPPGAESNKGNSHGDTSGRVIPPSRRGQSEEDEERKPDMSVVKVEPADEMGLDPGGGMEEEEGSDWEANQDVSHMSGDGSTPSWYTQTFKDFLTQNDEDPEFERLSAAELDLALSQFYLAAVIPPDQLKTFPEFLSCHLNMAPFCRNINIESDPNFYSSNSILHQACTKVHSDEYRRKKPMSQEDLNKLYESGVLSNHNPVSLQNKVWVELMIYIGGLARQDLRSLQKDNFVFEKDQQNRLYFRLDARCITQTKKRIRVYEQPDNLNCPVRSLWLYLSKLNSKSEVFFQQPLKEPVDDDDEVWYSHKPIGKNAHSSWLATICKEAGVTTEYRNQALYSRAAPIKLESGMCGGRTTKPIMCKDD